MATVVTRPRSSTLAAAAGSQTTASIVVKRASDITIRTISDVDSTDLQDGYSLIFDDDLGKFKTQPIANITLIALDGGTY